VYIKYLLVTPPKFFQDISGSRDPQVENQWLTRSRLKSERRDVKFWRSDASCRHCVKVLYKVTPKYFVSEINENVYHGIVPQAQAWLPMVEVENKWQSLSCVEFQVPGMEVCNSNCHVLVQTLLCWISVSLHNRQVISVGIRCTVCGQGFEACINQHIWI